MSRLLARLGTVIITGFALSVGFGSVASAHVTVHSVDAVQGGSAELAFRVPTESDTASTVKVQVVLPMDTPIAEISVQSHPGWAYAVTETTLPTPLPDGHGGQLTKVISQIDWSATSPDTAIKPGEYEVFRIVAGPLPKTDRLIFKVVQTYSDSQVARWIGQPAAAGGAAPEHPAAVLALTAAGSVGDVAHAGHATAAVTTPSTGTPALAWWAMAATAVVVLAALWAVVISVRTARRRGGGEATT